MKATPLKLNPLFHHPDGKRYVPWSSCRCRLFQEVQLLLSGCHFCCVPGVLPLHKRRGILSPPRSKGLFRKMTLVFPCFAVYVTYEEVSLSHGYRGRFPGNSPVLANYPNEKWHFENDTWTRWIYVPRSSYLWFGLFQRLQDSGKEKQHKHKLVGPDFLRTFLTLTLGCPWVKKFLPITGAAEKCAF